MECTNATVLEEEEDRIISIEIVNGGPWPVVRQQQQDVCWVRDGGGSAKLGLPAIPLLLVF